jgi:hypothetical protein
MRVRLLVAVAASVMSITSAVNAATAVDIEASGTFGANVNTTSISAPGATWSLSLTVLNPPVGTFNSDYFSIQYNGSSANNVYGLGATYMINGVTITGDPVDYIDFYDPADDGGVDFGFHDGTALSLYLGDIGSSGTILTGTWTITEDVNDEVYTNGISAADSSGTLTITDTTVQPVTPPPPVGTVPEPATWAFMMLGLGLVGVALRRRPTALVA